MNQEKKETEQDFILRRTKEILGIAGFGAEFFSLDEKIIAAIKAQDEWDEMVWNNNKQERESLCGHEWKEIDSQYNNEITTDVVCKKCGVHGEKDNKTGDVFYPAT